MYRPTCISPRTLLQAAKRKEEARDNAAIAAHREVERMKLEEQRRKLEQVRGIWGKLEEQRRKPEQRLKLEQVVESGACGGIRGSVLEEDCRAKAAPLPPPPFAGPCKAGG